jgi:hypothetical protein
MRGALPGAKGANQGHDVVEVAAIDDGETVQSSLALVKGGRLEFRAGQQGEASAAQQA